MSRFLSAVAARWAARSNGQAIMNSRHGPSHRKTRPPDAGSPSVGRSRAGLLAQPGVPIFQALATGRRDLQDVNVRPHFSRMVHGPGHVELDVRQQVDLEADVHEHVLPEAGLGHVSEADALE